MNLYMKICPIKMLYHILNEKESTHYAAIICTDEVINRTKLRNIPYIQAEFADIKTMSSKSFNRILARKIGYFVDNLPENVSVLYICCSAGESRSPAIAAAIMRYFGQSDLPIWRNPKYHPNIFVYKIMCEELDIRMNKRELRYLEKVNNKALSKAIKQSRQKR